MLEAIDSRLDVIAMYIYRDITYVHNMFGEKSRTLPLIDNCIINACFHVHMNITCKMSIWQRHHVLII